MASKEQYYEGREIFLKQFAFNILLNYHKILKEKGLLKARPIRTESIMPEMQKIAIQQETPSIRPVISVIRPMMPAPRVPMQRMQRRMPMQVVQVQPMPMQRAPMPIQQMQPTGTQIEGLQKLNSLLANYSIKTIECPGPDKPLIINRAGFTETTNIILTKEEIDKTMEEISARTRIPILPGVFKAAFDSYIISAVISEFVGTRFFLQRKQQMPMPIPR